MGKKSIGKLAKKLVVQAAKPPFSTVIAAVPGAGPIAGPGISILAQSAKGNPAGGGHGWNAKAILGATASQFSGKKILGLAIPPGLPGSALNVPGTSVARPPPPKPGIFARFNPFRRPPQSA